ncbi:GH36-type glycosyl hydrolase domain-containing protein [Pantoea sp. CCBC3-3-1]|uniref:GH36-type glycosyl hydrolase domain-containing protein n=1 Tax=Pantoea sp. CCBC3-3-1 TaxID=2490851 RepID=UPI0020C3D790|nr:glucoamylase family protein [Pantoea sp. CCBC3-3-1]
MKKYFNEWFGTQSGASLPHEKSVAAEKNIYNQVWPEIFSADQMAIYGEKLAGSHQLSHGKTVWHLSGRLNEDERLLTQSAEILSGGDKKSLTPAGLWLLDNFYLIEEQIRLVRQLLPAKFGKGLPVLLDSGQLLRIQVIAQEMVRHSDGRLESNVLWALIASYQRVTPLLLGELWALPAMLRLALIDNLARIATEVAVAHQERMKAEKWVSKILMMVQGDVGKVIVVVAEMAKKNPVLSGAFVAEMMRRMSGQSNMLAINWLEQHLHGIGLSTSQVIEHFNRQLSISQLSVSNSISGLRQLGETDWPEMIESLSLVEQTLRQDPAGIYSLMQFESRDHYRHVVETLARHSDFSEQDVAHEVLTLAGQQQGRQQHVGYYLLDKGRAELEKRLATRYSVITQWRHRLHQMPLLSWLGSLLLLTAAFSAELFVDTFDAGISRWLWLLLLPVIIVTSELALQLLSELTTRSRHPEPLASMDYAAAIPNDKSTLVAIPCLLGSQSSIDALLRSLEVCYLGNALPNLYFALLTDFTDSAEQSSAENRALLRYAITKTEALNRRYPSGTDNIALFSLLHRDSLLNKAQGVWMGYERKRGKIYALNHWLRHEADVFSITAGASQAELSKVNYVITLDSDTILPRETACKLIGIMAHPLNKPVFDESLHRVVEGYAILQPRMAEEIPVSGQGRYAKLCSSIPGNDPYSAISSDIYQDLFGEGSYIGKGIYEVDTFTRATRNTCPENLVLSHDLLEGCYARSGFISNVVLYEQYPDNYLVDVARRFRWIRGDWQLLNWLRLNVYLADGSRQKNPLSFLSRWKLLDNLRRSLVAPSLLLLLFTVFTLLPNPLYWICAILLVLILPGTLALALDAIKKGKQRAWRQHLKIVAAGSFTRLCRAGLYLATLPHESYWSVKAIVLTLWRLNVSHRYLHEWKSGGALAATRLTRRACYREMWINPLAGGLLLLLIAGLAPQLLLSGLPLAVLWAITPELIKRISQPAAPEPATLSVTQQQFLRRTARETWSFFTDFAGAEDNWLPPDNMQEIPQQIVAHRTSPTNIGLSLLANLTAWDFGYVTQNEVLTRTTATLDTLDRMDHYRGHLFNWYDTQTLAPLNPRYISSVDSGNMAGHLVTLQAGLHAWKSQPVVVIACLLEGLNDTLLLAEEHAHEADREQLVLIRELFTSLQNSAASSLLSALAYLMLTLSLQRQSSALPDERWISAFRQQIDAFHQEWCQFFSWLTPADSLPDTIPSLLWLAELNQHRPGLARTVAEPVMQAARQRLAILLELDQRLDAHQKMDFRFLYHPETALLSVGYNCENGVLDNGKYDLLPSEIRLTHYFAISTNQLPVKSWFALGRLFTQIDNQPAVMSWSGSMFEYLMPQLVMPVFPDTLLEQMARSAVQRQIAWGKTLNIPWGVSESGYAAFDANNNYQYKAFGLSELGLKRGLNEERVVAPYATLLALMVLPQEAIENLNTLIKWGAKGDYGFYEALDFTPERLPPDQKCVRISSYMAHHQGMGLLAIGHLLFQAPMVQRFMSSALNQSSRLLLQERMPDAIELYTPRRHFDDASERARSSVNPDLRLFTGADTPVPQVQLLSNAHYHLMVTQAGGGYSVWNGIALTRWRSDATSDNRGAFCYLSDSDSGETIGNTFQPCASKRPLYKTLFNDAGVEFSCSDGALTMHTHIVVSPEDDVEIRRITLTHRGRQPRRVNITTYAEVVLAPAASDLAHPAFSNLFVQTEILADDEAILAHRRPRDEHEETPWMFHAMVIHGAVERTTSWESDRAKFIGRGNTPANPHALGPLGRLSNSEGSVLDPILAMQQTFLLRPGEPQVIDIIYGVTMQRESTVKLIEKYRNKINANRVFEMAWSHSQVALRQLNVHAEDASTFNTLASAILFPCAEMRGDNKAMMRNRLGQAALWGHSISGDLPIVLLTLDLAGQLELVGAMIQAHAYLRHKGLSIDLVIINNDRGGYQQALHNQIMRFIDSGESVKLADQPGGIFVRKGENFTAEDRQLLMSMATVVIEGKRGSLASQLKTLHKPGRHLLPALFSKVSPRLVLFASSPPVAPLQFFNGTGGFNEDGSEYRIVLDPLKIPPAPWCNVLANSNFGSVISESGQGYSWYENAHEYRLTPWENDPVSDSGGEAFYLRDEETGHFWSPTPLPIRGEGSYLTRHGFGYSVFEHSENGIVTSLTVFVAGDAPVKLSVLTVRNQSGRSRDLSVTGYVEWVLGELTSKSAMHVATSAARVSQGAGILATNYYGSAGSERTAFFAVNGSNGSLSGNRRECLGRNGTTRQPEMMQIRGLSGHTGAGLDPCGALQRVFTLIDSDSRTFIFALGVGENSVAAEALIHHFLSGETAQEEVEKVKQNWQRVLHKIQIDTPDKATNLLTNGWLLYQTLASRLLARSGYYQSGGAFGFRDQLQDTLALLHAEPQRARAQILLCASRQFVEGDVQHWWHPPGGNGVRTRCSDDYLWLPFAICQYIDATDDMALLSQPVSYLEGRLLAPGEESVYERPDVSQMTETVWQHGVRAIKNGLRYGPHGLPLIGSGDWNDGMNTVGAAGKGESVWLGFFLYTVLERYAALAGRLHDDDIALLCRQQATTLKDSLNSHGWDGKWFLRGFFDRGEPLGSHISKECQIDAIAQSWSVLSQAGETDKRQAAMTALYERLVDRENGIIKLLTPPFDGAGPNPGYIRGYLPGVRENGGQYTHGAIWAIMAFAQMGEAERAWSLFALINPVNHSLTASAVARYKVEPYVMAADIYAAEPHAGRGGWSWYTGSAGWAYQLIIGSLLGIGRHADYLTLHPCLPADWPEVRVSYKEGESRYEITFLRGTGEYQLWVDDERIADNRLLLTGSNPIYRVKVLLEKAL